MKRLILGFLVASLALPACRTRSEGAEVIITANPFEWPLMPNCWTYSSIAWAEALVRKRTSGKENFSETYMTYRNFEDQLLNSKRRILDGSGNFAKARDLMLRYGLMRDSDFLPGLDEAQLLSRQTEAMSYLNDSLSSGVLASRRSASVIRAELNKAFGVNFDDLRSRVFFPKDIKVGIKLTLAKELARAVEVPIEARFVSLSQKDLPRYSKVYSQKDLVFMRRIIRNLNQGYPVILNWTVDFNGLSRDGNFDLEILRKAGPGRQTWQSSVVEEYSAEGPDSTGNAFLVREGSADRTAQNLAAVRGELTTLLVRNDWSGSERPQLAGTQTKNGVKTNRIKANYLFGYMAEMNKGRFVRGVRGVKSVIVSSVY